MTVPPHLEHRHRKQGASPTVGVNASHVVATVGSGDRAVAAIAGAQHGAISTAQLLTAGISASAIRRRVRKGWLHAKHRGVYLVGHASTTENTEMIAAGLAVGGGSVISHGSAIRMYGLAATPLAPIHLTVIGKHRRHRPGITAHEIAGLAADEIRMIKRIPVVAPARALLGFAATSGTSELQRALNEARARKLLSEADLRRLARRTPRARGWGRLGPLLALEEGPRFSRSEAELRLWRLIVHAGLPHPRRNARVGGYEVDFLWPAQGLVVEVDGFAYHSSPERFERDRAKWADLQALGLRVFSFTWKQIVSRREWTVARIATGLTRVSGRNENAREVDPGR